MDSLIPAMCRVFGCVSNVLKCLQLCLGLRERGEVGSGSEVIGSD